MNTSFPIKVSNPEKIEILTKKVGNSRLIKYDNSCNYIVESVSALHNADEASLAFCSRKNKKDIELAISTTLACIIVVSKEVAVPPNKSIIVTDDPLEWFIKALNLLFDFNADNSTRELIITSKTSSIAKNITVGENTVIERGCIIGENCIIGSNCFIGKNVIIGSNVFIQNNTSVGGVGLGYHISENGERLFFPHIGSVILGNNVVVGSNSVIVRGQLQDTVIQNKVRIGNLVNIAHNVTIGSETVISSSVCIAGGTSIGSKCNIGAGVIINAKKNIGNKCQIGLGSVVTKSLSDGMLVFGNPAKPLPTMRSF
jgi:UDP-3-O-[3-hydroxymyristoyl] glucosamine N-acyltransferase LpxD